MPTPKITPEQSQESQDKEKKQNSKIKEGDIGREAYVNNGKASEGLITVSTGGEQKKPPATEKKRTKAGVEKKERNWEIGIGTTVASNSDNSMEISTTGIKFENKKNLLEFTLGAATITEAGKPGSLPKQETLPGVSLIKRF